MAHPLPSIPFHVQRTINMIVVHCSATPSGQWLPGAAPGQAQTAADVINGWHAQRGFVRSSLAIPRLNSALRSIGYHYVIDLDGRVLTGRSLDEVGAHALGHNTYSVGICLVGGAERDARYTPAQWEALATMVVLLADRFWRGDITARRIVGHRDLSPDANGDGLVKPNEWLKTCPGFDVASWLARGMLPELAHFVDLPGQAGRGQA